MLSKTSVLFIGICALVVNVTIVGITLSYGLRGNLSLNQMLLALSEGNNLRLYLITFGCVLLSCGILYYRCKIEKCF